MDLGIGGHGNIERSDKLEARDQLGGIGIALRMGCIGLAGLRGIAAKRDDMPHACIPISARNLVDFTKAAPQVSSSGPGYSGGGMSNRMNNVQIDGASERDVFGLGSTGQPGGQISAKAISIDATAEL